MFYAWVTIENPSFEGVIGKDEGLQKMVQSDYKEALIAHANVVIEMAGYKGGKRFTTEDYEAMPGELELGAGLISRLFACNERGINYYEAREPVGE